MNIFFGVKQEDKSLDYHPMMRVVNQCERIWHWWYRCQDTWSTFCIMWINNLYSNVKKIQQERDINRFLFPINERTYHSWMWDSRYFDGSSSRSRYGIVVYGVYLDGRKTLLHSPSTNTIIIENIIILCKLVKLENNLF